MAEMRHRVFENGVLIEDSPIEQPPEPSTEERLAAVEDAVDVLILDQLMGGL